MATHEIYILQKKYLNGRYVMHDCKPICACEDYAKIVKHAKELRDYILKHNDDWFDQIEIEPLVAWNGFNYFAVGTSDKYFRIVFTITTIPVLD